METQHTEAPAAIDLDAELVALISSESLTIPPFPAVATKLQAVIQKPDYAVTELTEVMSADQALCASVLRYANSSVYQGASEVTELTTAIVRVGPTNTAKLALAAGLGSVSTREGPLNTMRSLVWRQGLFSAVVCQHIANRRKIPAEEAFMCGLLHDFGKVVALGCIELILKKHAALVSKPANEWMAMVDRYSHELNLEIASKWNLSPVLTEVMTKHRRPQSAERYQDLVELVHAVHLVALQVEARPNIAPENLSGIGFQDDAERAFIAELVQRMPQALNAFESGSDTKSTKSRKPAPSAVDRPDTTLSGVVRATAFPCHVLQVRNDYEFEAFEIATNGFSAKGPAKLHENALVKLTVKGVEIWAKISLCRPDGKEWIAQFQPYALGGEAKHFYDELYAAASS